MLKLKLQYFGHLMWRVDSWEKTLMLGGIGGRRRRVWQRMRWLDGITDLMDVSLNELHVSFEFEWTLGDGDGQGGLACCDSWGHKESDMTERLNWTELNWTEAEDIFKKWQEYTEELYQKDLHDQDNHDGVITHLEPDILESEVKWALGSMTINKGTVNTIPITPSFMCYVLKQVNNWPIINKP